MGMIFCTLFCRLILMVAIATASVTSSSSNVAEDPGLGGTYQDAAVVTDSGVCSEIGSDILRKNGSAVDSAITSLLCVGVMVGGSSGIGGGFFMVVYNRSNEKVEALNALETAYNATYPEMFDGQGKDGAKYGMKSVAIPGEMRGMWEAHQRYGRLPWSDLFRPVIDLARNGFRVESHLSSSLFSLRKRWHLYPSVREMYYNEEEGRVATRGDIITLPALADTLQAIADNGPDEFYLLDTARKFINDIKAGGGLMTMDDLANYRAEWMEVETLRGFSPSNHTVYSTTLTSSGPFLQFMLRTMDGFDLPTNPTLTDLEMVDFYHRFLEVCKTAFGMRTLLGDTWSPELERALRNLRSQEFSDFIRRQIENQPNDVLNERGEKYVFDFDVGAVEGENDDIDKGTGDTSHVSVLAPNGDAVSVTTSVGYTFGCKDMSLSTGIVPNNHIRNFNFETKYKSWRLLSNKLSPGKRPLSTMGPSILVDQNGDVKMVIGASGGMRIPSSNALVILRTLVMNVPLHEAIAEGRIHNYLLTNKAYYEDPISRAIRAKLRNRGHVVERSPLVASVLGILRTDQGIAAYSDPRKGGRAAGF
ncbi:glutathione hydrolase 1 proenzyme-like [Diadema setosum]|uniref:glutathione hydrolase 1 proenzyme-like n=1 Tax=Diadema setosum TaxID=31175 RepID=UPI003B3ACA70